MKQIIFLLLFFYVLPIEAQNKIEPNNGVKKYIDQLNAVNINEDVEKQLKKIEEDFLITLKDLQQECEEDFLTLRLGANRSSRARLTRKEKQMCLSKAGDWSRQFRTAKFEIRKKALKIIYNDQLKSLDKLQENVPIKK